MKYVKRFIKIFIFLKIFGTFSTKDMAVHFTFLGMIDIMIFSFLIYSFFSLLHWNKLEDNNVKILGEATVDEYLNMKANIAKYNPFIISYIHNKRLSGDKGLYIELYYLLFKGYLKINKDKIFITDKERSNLNDYEQYVINRIENNEQVIFKDWKKIYVNDMKKMNLIESESNINILKGILLMIISVAVPLVLNLVTHIESLRIIALLGIISMFTGINYFVEGFFMMFDKKINYTQFGLSVIKSIKEFSDYVGTHLVFSKEENIVLYYEYLLYRYSLFDENKLFKDDELKPVYDIIKKYVFSN